MCGVVTWNDFFKWITLLKFHLVESDDLFQHTLTSLILCHKLDKLIYDSLEIRICFIPQFAIGIQVHEKFHTLSLRITCLTNESEEEESSGKDFQMSVMQVDVQCVLSGAVGERELVGQGFQDVTNVSYFGKKHIYVPIILVFKVNAWLLEEVDTRGETVEGDKAETGSHFCAFFSVWICI